MLASRRKSLDSQQQLCRVSLADEVQPLTLAVVTDRLDLKTIALQYMAMTHIESQLFDRELKKGSAELLIMSLVEARPRHGYEISKLIEQRSAGALRFNVASLYPLLYRLEKRGWIQGRWVEKAGQRRRRYYRLTTAGRDVLASQRRGWETFVQAVNSITATVESGHA
jgi:PadR family transcriptional regulator, regulatory protein PadR